MLVPLDAQCNSLAKRARIEGRGEGGSEERRVGGEQAGAKEAEKQAGMQAGRYADRL